MENLQFLKDNYLMVTRHISLDAVEGGMNSDPVFQFEQQFEYITGVAVGGSDIVKVMNRGRMGLRIEQRQYFENSLPSQINAMNIQQGLIDRYYPTGIVPLTNKTYEVRYTDEANALSAFGDGYQVFIYFLLWMKKPNQGTV